MGSPFGAVTVGGPITLLILLAGALGVVVILERIYVVVVRSKNDGRQFIERVIQLVRASKIEEAIKQCAASTAALSDIGLLILRSHSRDDADLQKVAAAASLMLIPKLTRRIDYLPTLALVALLLGILGTLMGIRAALLAPVGATRDAWPALAASMTTTELGLGVAIVLIAGRGYLMSQSDSITEQIREFSTRLVNALTDRPDVRLGHR